MSTEFTLRVDATQLRDHINTLESKVQELADAWAHIPEMFREGQQLVVKLGVPPSRLDFGEALSALKSGHRVRRAGWNGKGMWLALTEGSRICPTQARAGAAAALVQAEDPSWVHIGAHIDMRAADGTLVIGWLASQTDMLAEDWEIVS